MTTKRSRILVGDDVYLSNLEKNDLYALFRSQSSLIKKYFWIPTNLSLNYADYLYKRLTDDIIRDRAVVFSAVPYRIEIPFGILYCYYDRQNNSGKLYFLFSDENVEPNWKEEALFLFITYCVAIVGLEYLETEVLVKNEEELNSLLDIGFKSAGVLKSKYKRGYKREDAIILYLLSNEFLENNREKIREVLNASDICF